MAAADYQKSKRRRFDLQAAADRQKRRRDQHYREDRNINALYQKKAKPLDLGKFEFRLMRHRKSASKHKRQVNLKGYIVSIDWTEGDGPPLTGSVTLMVPRRHRKHPNQDIIVKDGDKLVLECKRGHKWREVWRMRVWALSESVSGGALTLTLYDDLQNLVESQASFSFTKSKHGKHKDGWRADQIAAEVAQRFKLRIGKLAKTKRQINDLTMHKAGGLDPIIKAYKLEKEETGKQYVLHWKNGKLNIERLRRQPFLNVMRHLIQEAVIGHERDDRFFTVLTLSANTDQQGGDSNDQGDPKDKLEVTVQDDRAVKRFGYIEHEDTVDHNVKGKEKLKAIALQRIAKAVEKRTMDGVEIDHPGVPWIRKGDAVQVKLPEYGFRSGQRDEDLGSGNWNVFFVKTASHTIAGGDYNMHITFGIQDPKAQEIRDVQEIKDEERRQERRDDRNDDDGGDNNDGGTNS